MHIIIILLAFFITHIIKFTLSSQEQIMNTYPIIRIKWSNDHIMAAVFFVALLYLIPQWILGPNEVFEFTAVLVFGLLLDITVNFLRFKKISCSVSAAVTVAVLQVLSPGIPIWGRFVGVAFALFICKHIEGGTGKNVLNPAITGLLLLNLIFDIRFPNFSPTLLLIPAIILSLPFLRLRPFVGVSSIVGMILALIVKQQFCISNVIAFGVVFWGCIILADPVTTTARPVVGTVLGFLCGFIPLAFSRSVYGISTNAVVFFAGILALNVISSVTDFSYTSSHFSKHIKIKRAIAFDINELKFLDFTDPRIINEVELQELSEDEILQRIKNNRLYGMGGAAFPVYDKVTAALNANVKEKHLIVNGVECDPGLLQDKWLLHKYINEINKGTKCLDKIIGFKSVTFAVREIDDLTNSLNVYRAPGFYTAGVEKFLIKEILGLELKQESIPAKEGILVLNAQTVFSLYEAVFKNIKADTKFITVANIKDKAGMVVRVPLGANIFNILKKSFPDVHFSNVFCGGGIMQCRLVGETDVIDKQVNFIAISDSPKYKESPVCLKCGMCLYYCPAGLKVNEIANFIDNDELVFTERYHAEKCMKCGICSYVCLAGRDLCSRLKIAKEYLKETETKLPN